MPHGVDLLRCLERVRSAQNTEESTSCTLSIKIEPDSRGSSPAMTNERGLPLFPERADFKLERPCAARLLVKLPVGGGDRRRGHQQIGIIKRFPAPHLLAALAHPSGVDAGIDAQVRDVDGLGSELAPHGL